MSVFLVMLLTVLAAASAAKLCQSCPTLCDPIDSSPPGSHPWDSPGKNTGVGCHFLLQCMKVKNESEVAQSCAALHDPMDCSLPGSSVHGISQARVLEWVAIAFSDSSGNISYKDMRGPNIWPDFCSSPDSIFPKEIYVPYIVLLW